MKKIKKILPIVGVAGALSCTIPCFTSCSKKTLAELEWDVTKQGINAYANREFGTGYRFQKYEDATDFYFNEVANDYSIFTYDVINTLTHNMREWAYNFIGGGDPFGLLQYEMKCTWAKVTLRKWDTKTHRISFDIEAKVANEDNSATGECKFSWVNHPIALTSLSPYDLGYWSTVSYEEYDELNAWRIMPVGFAEYVHSEDPQAEVVDPLYPMGVGGGHMLMCLVDDWEMIVDETYHLPGNNTFRLYDYYNPTWLKTYTTAIADDPEIFGQVKYFFTFMLVNTITYMKDCQLANWIEWGN